MPTNWDVLKARLMGEKQHLKDAVAPVIAPVVKSVRKSDRENPLQLIPGEVILIDLPDHKEDRYIVTNIDHFKRVLAGVDMSFSEYTLRNNLNDSEGGDGKYRYLRVIPHKDQASGRVDLQLVLSEYMWCEDATDEELAMPEAEFVSSFKRATWLSQTTFTKEDGDDYAGYERSGGLTHPYPALVTERDETDDRKVRDVRYWDFTKWDPETKTLSIWFFELSLRDRSLTAMHGIMLESGKIRTLRSEVIH